MLAPNTSGHRSQTKSAGSAGPYSISSSIAFAREQGGVLISDAWVQEGPPSQTITAAYIKIENQTGADISLRSASMDDAQTIELHKMELVSSIMKMRRLKPSTFQQAAGLN